MHRFTSLVLIRLKENKTTPTKNKNKTKTPQILCILGGLQITQLIDVVCYSLINCDDLLQPPGVVMEMSEEDQMMQAIALSLGENVVMSSTEEVTWMW